MDKKEHSLVFKGLLREFFHSRIYICILASVTVLLAGIYLYFLALPDAVVFPGHEFNYGFYNDSGNGGKSKILAKNVTDSVIILDFELEKGFVSPYVGMSIAPKANKVINLSHYNQIVLDIQGHDVKKVGFNLVTQNPYARYNKVNRELSFFTNVDIGAIRHKYNLDISRFKLPDWWMVVNNITSGDKIDPDLKHTISIAIGTAYPNVLGSTCSLRIYSIVFHRDNSQLTWILSMLELAVLFLLLIIFYLQALFRNRTLPITITYKAVVVEKEDNIHDTFLSYINSHFQEDTLTLDQVSFHTGINQRRIANAIRQSFGCNFKTYVNQIRINESKRLLKESGLNMGEIAFKVGFGNQSHFNRVFKNIVGISPSEFRENQ